jgi:DNA-binding transcriptional LysR family regulator
MDFRRLQCFVALAEELHFNRAAKRLHMTQPAVSQNLRQLEADVKVQLVARTRRHVALTRAGETFLVEARRLLEQADTAVERARRMDRGETGQLHIGTTQSALFIVLPEILRRFKQRLPDVGVIVQEMNGAAQEQALLDGDIQVGMLHPPLSDASLRCRIVARIKFDVALSAESPLAKKKELTLKDLARERFVLFPRQLAPGLYDEVISLCQRAGFSPQIVLETTPAQTIIAYVAAGFGTSFIASKYQQARRPGVVYRRIRGPGPEMLIGVAYQAESMSPSLRAFLDAASTVGIGRVMRAAS